MTTITEYMDKTDSAVIWTDQAREEYRRMAYQVANLSSYYGRSSNYHLEAAESFARVSESIVGWGNIRVGRDGDLSLICRQASGFTFGIVYHRVSRSCTVADCPKYMHDDGHVWSYERTDSKPVQLHRHQWLYPIDAPTPGSWSFHS
jgi:hypothetical protein